MGITWNQAVSDYEKKKSGGSGRSGGMTWQQAVEEYSQYDSDGYKSLGQERIANRKKKYAEQRDRNLGMKRYHENDTVNGWLNRFDEVTRGVSDYDKKRAGGYTRDASGGYSRAIDSLMSDYEGIKNYPETKKYFDELTKMKNSIREIDDSMAQFKDEEDYNRQRAYWQAGAASGGDAPRQGIAVDMAQEKAAGLPDYRQVFNQRGYRFLPGAGEKPEQSLTAAQIGEMVSEASTEVDGLREQLRSLQQRQAGFSRSFTVGKEEQEQVKSQIEETKRALKEADGRLSGLQWEQTLAQREETVAAYDSNRDDPAFQEYVDKGKNGTYSRKEDPLGYYLKNRKMLELQSAYGGAPDSNLREMEEEEQEMYYYLLGSQGSKAAKKYLDDMQVLLDKRVHDKAQANIQNTYQNANLVGKVGLNAMSVPANVFGGITAPIGDAASALSGKGYNPYNAGHNGQDFASTVRGLTSQDIMLSLESDEVKNMRAEYERLQQKDVKSAFGLIDLSDEEARQLDTRLFDLRDALNKVEEPFWGKVAANTYQAVMSGADSALGATLFQNGYTAIMGAGTASQRARELWEAGASDAQIGMGAMASGLIEMATEKYSVEYFTKNFLKSDITGFKDWMAKTLIQGFNEGSEEIASELANMAAEAMILGANSDNQREIRKLMETEGLSREEAEKKAFVNRAMDILWAGYGGFVSGGAMGGIGGATNMAMQSQQNRWAAQMVRKGLESPEGSESRSLAQEYQKKLDSGEKLTGAETQKMALAYEAQARTELENDGFHIEQNSKKGTTEVTFAQKPDAAVQEALKENGFKWSKKSGVWYGEGSPEQARQIVQRAMGGTQTDSRQSADATDRIKNESEPGEAGRVESKTAENGSMPEESALQDIAQDEKAETKVTEEVSPKATTEASETVQEDMPFEVSSAEGKTTLNRPDGSSVDTEIIDIASSEKGKLMLNVAGQSEPVPASSISYASTDEAILYHAINSMDLKPAAAREIVKMAHNTPGSGGELAFQVSQMYTLGENGVPLDKAKGSVYGEKLNDAMKEFGYYLGRRVYDANVQKAEAKKKALAAAQRARAVQSGQKVNGVQYDGLTATRGKDGSVAIDGVTLNDQQKTGIQAAEMLASMGVNIHIFQSRTGANGKPVGEHGSYHRSDGSIHIDLNAGNDGQGVMAYTIAHEFTHFMEDQSPAMFQRFTDILFAELKTDVAARVYDKADTLKQQHPNIYKNASREKLMADARSEVVAECCETMLTDTDAAARIGQRLAQQDRTLFEKIRQWFHDLAKRLRDAYKGLEPDSTIAQEVKQTIQQVDDLVQLWADMAVDAAENYREADAAENEKSTVQEDGVKYMARINDKEGLSIKEQIRNAKDILDKMEPVVSVSVKDLSGMNQNQKYKWAIETLKSSGFKVDREGFGVITFSEKQINTGMNYLHSEGEVEALAALPRVLKRGRIIFEKGDHKFRNFGTVTIAAPVNINGQTGYMGVVVQMTSDNHYHTHRILMPDGSSFIFEQKNTAPGPSGDLAEEARRATNTSAASNNFLSQSGGNVKEKFSLRDLDRNVDNKTPTDDPDIRFSDRSNGEDYSSLSYSEISQKQSGLNQRESDLRERKRKAESAPELLD